MAMEDFDISDLCDDGGGFGIIHYLETDASRTKMVGQPTKK